ncbi:hypothetical protein JTB14_023730 [Gonioctena quinquepunctata]|nr:hypothetical protein JTB14_023730 [Gonioctena quinquepunctata]
MSSIEDLEGISCSTKLKDATTFPIWEFPIDILFDGKNLMEIVDGGGEKPADAEKLKKWKARDAQASKLHLENSRYECKDSSFYL